MIQLKDHLVNQKVLSDMIKNDIKLNAATFIFPFAHNK